MHTYVNREAKYLYASFNDPLDDNYAQGTTYEEYINGDPAPWIPLSDEQLAFHELNPNASVREVINMTLDQPPVVDPVDPVEEARRNKISEIIFYDQSDNINTFTLNNQPAWLTPDKRSAYATSLSNAELLGETNIEFEINGQIYDIPVSDAKIVLAKVGRYADKAYMTTRKHIKAVKEMTSVDDIKSYDYTVGYPDKEKFMIE